MFPFQYRPVSPKINNKEPIYKITPECCPNCFSTNISTTEQKIGAPAKCNNCKKLFLHPKGGLEIIGYKNILVENLEHYLLSNIKK